MSDADNFIGLDVNQELLNGVLRATKIGVEMAGLSPKSVGVSKFLRSSHRITTLVGLMGEASTGTLILNMSERLGLLITERMLMEKQVELTEDALDAIGEIGNMISGAMKDLLADTDLAIQNISCPAVVMGASYDLYYSSGFQTVTVEFEIDEIPVVHMDDRVFSVGVSLMKR